VGREVFRLGLDGVDAFGIVFFGQYSHWFQHAIERFMEDAGHPLRDIIGEGFGFPVVRFELECFTPARLSEVIYSETRLTDVGSRSMRFEVRFTDPGGALFAVARSVQVTTRKDLTGEPVPAWLRELQGPLSDR
jgi:acyl-CoA thioester hydrolase